MTSTRRVFSIRVDNTTPEIIEGIAASYGCYRVQAQTRDLVGAAGVLLDRIAAGRLKVVPGDVK